MPSFRLFSEDPLFSIACLSECWSGYGTVLSSFQIRKELILLLISKDCPICAALMNSPTHPPLLPMVPYHPTTPFPIDQRPSLGRRGKPVALAQGATLVLQDRA